MANLSPSLATTPSFDAPSPPPFLPPPGWSTAVPTVGGRDWNMVSVEQLTIDICDPELREKALFELFKVSYSPASSLPPGELYTSL